MNKKLVRITTIPLSLEKLLENQLKFMKNYYAVTAISSDKERLYKYGTLEGLNVYHLDLTRQITPVKDLIALFKLVFFLRKHRPFIVHTHTPKAGTIGMLAALIASVPNRLHTVAGLPLLETNGSKRVLLNLVEKLTYKCATRVYPNSTGLKNIIISENFCEPKKLKILANGSSNGIDTKYFSPSSISQTDKASLKSSLNCNNDDLIFIFVGRLVKDKGINELVTAFKSFNLQSRNSKLLLVGETEENLDPLLPNTLEEIEKNPDIITVGFQSDVRSYFAISDVLVFPSYREGFPNVVMQAGAMNLPSIVSDINGCNEIVENNKNGLVIPVKDEKAILDAMLMFKNDLSLLQKLKNNARNVIVERYEQQTVWNAILKEYKSLENV